MNIHQKMVFKFNHSESDLYGFIYHHSKLLHVLSYKTGHRVGNNKEHTFNYEVYLVDNASTILKKIIVWVL